MALFGSEMSKQKLLTADEQQEIVQYIATRTLPGRVKISLGDVDKNEGWLIVLVDEHGLRSDEIHPRAFLDIIREVTDADTLTKDPQVNKHDDE